MDPRVVQLNAAGAALNAAVEAIRTAPDDADLAPLEAAFREAQVEFQRCQGNAELASEAARAPKFTPAPVENPNQLGMEAREVRAYSLIRGIRAAMTGDWSDAGLEREASQAVAQRLGKEPAGFYVPMDVQAEKRADMDTSHATYASNLVATELLGASFIDLLRNKMVVKQAGATMLSGLVGNIAIPRQSGAGTYYWVGATTTADITAETYPTVDQVTMTPHVGGAYTDIGRTLILQSSIDVEAMVRRDIANICALGLDLAALSGTGQTVYPEGIVYASPNTVVGGANGLAPTWANIVDFETQVSVDNADVGAMAYVVNAKTRGYLKATPKVATYSATMMWDSSSPATPVNGYPAFVSNQVRSGLTKGSATTCSEIFFGNWNDLIIGQWGTLDILVDPYTGALAGTVRIRALQDVDVCVRHPESFCYMADALCGA